MPAWSIAEWRARIGSSWCTLGRPFKARSPFRNKERRQQRVFTLNQVVALMVFVMIFIGLNLRLCVSVAAENHHSFLTLHSLVWMRALPLLWKIAASNGQENNGCSGVSKKEAKRTPVNAVMLIAASVIFSLLLISGDVEQNPGPGLGDLDYDYVDATQILEEDDLPDIMEEILSIKSAYFRLGQWLRLKNDDLKVICEAYPNGSDNESALNDVLLLWLQQKYNVKKFGPPTWKMLVMAIDKRTGGNNHSLAKEIASNHPAVAGAGTQVSHVAIAREDPDYATLGIENAKEILDLTWKYRARWRLIGTELGIDEGTLDAISLNETKVEHCLREMSNTWLRSDKLKPTRSAMKAALNSERVSANKLEGYTAHLKTLYKTKAEVHCVNEDIWPPPIMKKVFRLAMIMAEKVQLAGDFVRKTITGKVDDILQNKIPIELKDILKGGKQETVLIEGAPGCGKSTLSLHICQQWAEGLLFQEFKHVILVMLREQAVQKAKNIADLLPHQSKAKACEIEDELITCNGKDVLFVLDGWDELPPTAPGCSIIKDILGKTKVRESSVIITSRPTSSAILHEVADSRIEILGFTERELELYFAGCLENNIKNAKILLQRVRENPVVAGSCYLPLNASILVHLFKVADDHELPKTQFDIFSLLICNCIYRHQKKTTQQKISVIKSLDNLPQELKNPFNVISKIAYNGIMEDRVIFMDLDYDFNTLGLLQGVENFTVSGMSHSYIFLHLSIQELLAAFYMATQLKPEEQVEQFRELFGRARFSAVFQFYAAKTKLQTTGIDCVLVDAVRKCLIDRTASELTPSKRLYLDVSSLAHKPQPLLLSVLHCLYEAQDKSLCESVVKLFNLKLNLCNIRLNPVDCLAVGFFLTHCKQFQVDLEGCSISLEGCKTLFRSGEIYDLHILNLYNNSIGAEGAIAISDSLKTMTNLQTLDLYYNFIGDKGAVALSEALKTMTNLQWLGLRFNSIGTKGAVAISEAMKKMANLQALDIWFGNDIGEAGLQAITEAANMTGTKFS